ncbi:MAG: shikimate dehydrogenase [Pseudomonadales bacterium]|jgi:shikimate dehydrogenase
MSEYKLAVLGQPIAHSRSPEIHGAFARQAGISINYEKIEIKAGDFNNIAKRLVREGYRGFNITLPCKRDAYLFATSCSDTAAACEAVNTITMMKDGLTRGDNTDGPGLVRDLTTNLGWQIKDMRVLVLGAGGAVRGVVPDLLAALPVSIHIFNRTYQRANIIAQNIADVRVQAVQKNQLEESYDLVINGTSAGLSAPMTDNALLPEFAIGQQTRCYDMIYGSSITTFNQWFRQISGGDIADGLGMLVEQAALSFRHWFSKEVETAPVIAALRKSL